jgi:hypothetical protein
VGIKAKRKVQKEMRKDIRAWSSIRNKTGLTKDGACFLLWTQFKQPNNKLQLIINKL